MLWILHTFSQSIIGRVVRVQSGHTSVPSCVTFLETNRIISGGYDNMLISWDINSGRETKRFAASKAIFDLDINREVNQLVLTAGADLLILNSMLELQ
jgi:WD40 repeat protein